MHILNIIENLYEIVHVMAIHWPKITDAESFEQVMLPCEQRLQAVVETQDILPAVIIDQIDLLQTPIDIIAHLIIGLTGRNIHQILAQTSYTMVNGHIVIIQDNQQIIGINRRIIQSLKGQATRHRTITNHRDHMPIILTLQSRSNRQPHSGRDGIRGMACDKRIILTLRRVGEPTDPP